MGEHTPGNLLEATLLANGEKLAAVLRWYLLHYGNAGGAEYALDAWEHISAIARAEAKP
jgi:hypothetical protein